MHGIILGDEMELKILHASLLHGSYAWKLCMGIRLRSVWSGFPAQNRKLVCGLFWFFKEIQTT